MKYPIWVYEIVAKFIYNVVSENPMMRIEMYEISTGGQAELKDILMKYGKTIDCRKLQIMSVKDYR